MEGNTDMNINFKVALVSMATAFAFLAMPAQAEPDTINLSNAAEKTEEATAYIEHFPHFFDELIDHVGQHKTRFVNNWRPGWVTGTGGTSGIQYSMANYSCDINIDGGDRVHPIFNEPIFNYGPILVFQFNNNSNWGALRQGFLLLVPGNSSYSKFLAVVDARTGSLTEKDLNGLKQLLAPLAIEPSDAFDFIPYSTGAELKAHVNASFLGDYIRLTDEDLDNVTNWTNFIGEILFDPDYGSNSNTGSVDIHTGTSYRWLSSRMRRSSCSN